VEGHCNLVEPHSSDFTWNPLRVIQFHEWLGDDLGRAVSAPSQDLTLPSEIPQSSAPCQAQREIRKSRLKLIWGVFVDRLDFP